MTDGCDISSENAFRRTSLDLSDDKSTLVQMKALCRQATSHYLSQCWPKSVSPYGVTRPQWVKYKLYQTWYKSLDLLCAINVAPWQQDRNKCARCQLFCIAPVIYLVQETTSRHLGSDPPDVTRQRVFVTLTQRGLNKMAAMLHTTFYMHFRWRKFEFHWSSLLQFQLSIGELGLR